MKKILTLLFPAFLLFGNPKCTLFSLSGKGDAEMLTLLKEERKKTDFPITTLYSQFENFDVWNQMDIDLALYSGREHLKENIDKAQFPFLTSHFFDLEKEKPPLKEFFTFSPKGVKIGIFSLTFSKIGFFPSHLYIAKKIVKTLKKEACQAIILLSDLSMRENLKIARELPLIDVILGHGEKDIVFYEGETLLIQSEKNSKTLERLDIAFEEKVLNVGSHMLVHPYFRKIDIDHQGP